ncbi:condensation domain-containing protein [Lysobacter enzymogenes]|uniref:condensation domain-containing protein n=1 Tax=Lysobacter enzymogenes TaxID=69 RepID=UPI00099DD09E|nr:condensation domain-containing protein [Lysobacter enzymogenes]UZW58362.1 condensation domain-containing protein [Lysobacter enzymogenes]
MSELSDRIGRLPPEKQALFRLMLKQRGLGPQGDDAIPRAAQAESYPLSFSQQRLWFLDQMAPGNAFYNEPLLALRIEGRLDRDALAATIDAVVRRHESLRTRFASFDGRPVQIIAPAATVPIVDHDLRHLPFAARESELQRLAQEEASRPFDLAQGPLLRVSLIRLDEHDHTALLEMHHIITDGWSNRLLLREILALYAAISRGEPDPLPAPPIRYADFAVWQRKRLSGAAMDKLVRYWTRQLAGDLPVSQFPADFPRPAVQRYLGRLETRMIAADTSEGVRRLGRRHDCTLFMTLFAAFVVLLQRHTGHDDVVVGTPVANRNRTETESVIGFFVNTLVMRVDASGGPRFSELLERVRKVAIDAYAHEDLPFEKLVEVLRPERNLDRQALFQILFGLHNYPDPAQAIEVGGESLRLSRIEVDGGESKVDWALSITDLDGEGIKAQINYNTDLYRAATMQRLLRQYENILRHVAAEPDARLNAIPVFGADDDADADRAHGGGLREKLKTVRRKPVAIDANAKGDRR